jgi:hypothetical protein
MMEAAYPCESSASCIRPIERRKVTPQLPLTSIARRGVGGKNAWLHAPLDGIPPELKNGLAQLLGVVSPSGRQQTKVSRDVPFGSQ